MGSRANRPVWRRVATGSVVGGLIAVMLVGGGAVVVVATLGAMLLSLSASPVDWGAFWLRTGGWFALVAVVPGLGIAAVMIAAEHQRRRMARGVPTSERPDGENTQGEPVRN